MKTKSWPILLVALLLVGNTFVLPKLMAGAQALPEGEIVVQQTVSTAERTPLPEAPEGFGVPYDLKFSRPLSESEQSMWDALTKELAANSELIYTGSCAAVTYTQRAQTRLIEAILDGDEDPESEKGILESYPIGERAEGSVLIDLGTVTLCIGDATLIRETALPLARRVVSDGEKDSLIQSDYNIMYIDFLWMKPQTNARYTLSRSLSDGERPRYMRLKTDYMLSGLRPSSPLATAAPTEDSLWFDKAATTIHLPAKSELTDDEMLHYIELTDTLTRQALLAKTPDMITEQQAVEIAKAWAETLFGLNVKSLSVFASPTDDSDFSEDASSSEWRIQFGPEDMLIRQAADDDEYEGCELFLDATDGSLLNASRTITSDDIILTDKTETQIRKELKQKAAEIVRSTFENGEEPKRVTISWIGTQKQEDSGIPSEIGIVVTMKNGVDYELSFSTGNADLISYRYWPDGCENMG